MSLPLTEYLLQSHTELLPADMFLERCPLPRVVRISSQFGDETIQSSSSNGSGSSASAKKDSKAKQNGELCLLFRHLKNRKIYHGVSTKNGSARKKGVMIPQEFPGEFKTPILIATTKPSFPHSVLSMTCRVKIITF